MRTDTPSLHDMFTVFGRIGILSFGGPAAQIALMHKELVEDRPWLKDDDFLRALSFCMLLPGPEAMQLATYAGWRLRGLTGGFLAGLLFVLPGAAVILALASAYAALGDVPLVQTLFLGVKAAVVVIVVQALLKVAKKALKTRSSWIIAGLSFLGLYVAHLPFPLIIGLSALYGFLTSKRPEAPLPPAKPAHGHLAVVVPVGLALWLGPVLGLQLFAPEILSEIALFFSKLAVVTFGGAYAVLAYMTQEVVTGFGWLTTAEMIDGLGLAETTPGPLILVTEFVGFLAGAKAGGWGMGAIAALVTLWVTFAPCFLWIFAGAPYIEHLARQPRLSAALAAVTAAVVGVILNLSLWFALHVFFTELSTVRVGPFGILIPMLSSLDLIAALLCAVAGALIFWRNWSLIHVLIVIPALGMGIYSL